MDKANLVARLDTLVGRTMFSLLCSKPLSLHCAGPTVGGKDREVRARTQAKAEVVRQWSRLRSKARLNPIFLKRCCPLHHGDLVLLTGGKAEGEGLHILLETGVEDDPHVTPEGLLPACMVNRKTGGQGGKTGGK